MKYRPLWFLPVVLIGLLLIGCTGSAPARGWSGVAVSDNSLFVGSTRGNVVAVNASDFSRLWSVKLETQAQGGGGFGCAPAAANVPVYGTPAVSGDFVYVAGYDGKIFVISASTRLSESRYLDPNNRQPIVGGPVVDSGRVFIGSADGKVYCLDAASRENIWTFVTGDKIWATPAVSDNTVYIGSMDSKFYALNAADGTGKWRFDGATGAIVSTALVQDGAVYFGSFDRNLYALNAATGELVWQYRAGNWFWAKPVVHQGVVYAPNLDGKVYALDAGTGSKVAEFDMGSGISSSPVVVNSSVIVATEAGAVYSIDTVNRQHRQLTAFEEKVNAPLAASGDTVYVHTVKDNLYAINAQSGAVRALQLS